MCQFWLQRVSTTQSHSSVSIDGSGSVKPHRCAHACMYAGMDPSDGCAGSARRCDPARPTTPCRLSFPGSLSQRGLLVNSRGGPGRPRSAARGPGVRLRRATGFRARPELKFLRPDARASWPGQAGRHHRPDCWCCRTATAQPDGGTLYTRGALDHNGPARASTAAVSVTRVAPPFAKRLGAGHTPPARLN